MSRSISRACPLLLVALLVSLPASAELYNVKLKNGTVISSRHQPQFAAWDQNVILVLTDVGNWTGLEVKDVESVTTDTQVRGFAVRLNATTVFLGWSANDGSRTGGGVEAPEAEKSYDQKQFVDPSEAGGGFPTSFSYANTGGGEGGGFEAPATPPAPAPAAPAPSAPPAEAPPQQ